MSFKKLRKNLFFRTLSIYMALTMIFPSSIITSSYALTGGPSQPEFNSFTPIGTSDMVNLSSGDFNYNIPIMDVGGYPINLAYDSGVTTDQEASWVGLGWNLNVGQINRSVRGLPDDFDGDEMIYENNIKNNVTVGSNFGLKGSIFGFSEKSPIGGKVSIQYNNYEGITVRPSLDVSFDINKKTKIGFNTELSSTEGVSISKDFKIKQLESVGGTLGVEYNSRQGLTTSLKGQKSFFKKGAEKSFYRLGGAIPITFNDYRLFTPTKRIGMQNYNFSFKATVGLTMLGGDGNVDINGFGSLRTISPSEKNKEVKAYGYQYSENNHNGIMDFNREKERGYSKLTKMLAVTNYTYDLYSISGQGIGGAFRPYRSQVGYVHSMRVSDSGFGLGIGAEGRGGNIAAPGVDVKASPSRASSGEWTTSYDTFKYEESSKLKNDYEKVYFRLTGEQNVDSDLSMYTNQLKNETPIAVNIEGDRFDRKLSSAYKYGNQIESAITGKIMRSTRLLRNTAIQKITKDDALHDAFIKVSQYAKKKHTAGYKILKPDGSNYVYGKTLYNVVKKEASFAVSGTENTGDGLFSYDSNGDNPDNSVKNKKGVDRFFNRVTTPAYAHTYLLTSILSSDYEDSDDIAGPSDGDVGSYTKFKYDNTYKYKWRVPFKQNKVSANPGFYSHPEDQKGNYVYGEREQSYVRIIETKTHIAIFHVSDRLDAFGVRGENGGKGDNSVSKQLDKIELFSKEDYYKNSTNAVPIKVAHFKYDYSLSKSLPNSFNNTDNLNPNKGKLTLIKVYFTYGKSNMGRYTPYTFDYGQYRNEQGKVEDVINPEYGLKSHDIWGNYKKNEGINGVPTGPLSASVPTNIEYPYVEQDKNVADKNAVAWTLTTVHLPSGGEINIEFESNDYQYVQNKRAMQLFQVEGVGDLKNDDQDPDYFIDTIFGNDVPCLYKLGDDADYVFINIGNSDYTVDDYTEAIKEKPIFFKFLLNMGSALSKQYDFVTGYFFMNGNAKILTGGDHKILAIPMKKVDKEGGVFTSGRQVNPISKAGWYFGRNNMNRIVYSSDHSYAVGSGDNIADQFVSIISEIVGSLASAVELISGPNGVLRSRDIANYYVPKKSWVRLVEPSRKKLGGGARVKKISMRDNWGEMIDISDDSDDFDDLYNNIYGQVYNYEDVNGYSSGVASFEPSGSKENPLVAPIYDTDSGNARDRLLAPRDQNYFEGPIGESFYPSPKITYGRVAVKNLPNTDYSQHGSGSVVNQFYTSFDFPTVTSFTPLKKGKSLFNDDNKFSISNIMNFSVKNHLTLSQGFTIEVNDMDGKQKSQEVLSEQGKQISKVEYEYFRDPNTGNLKNDIMVVDKEGNISKKLLGVNYDVINDFNQSISSSETVGVNLNVHSFVVILPLIIPTAIPDYAHHENKLFVSTTTKVVQRHGILKKKIVYDLGARVSTENLAWDAQTGQVLVTKTHNEFSDAYYSTSYPAYWHNGYDGMRQASINLGIEGKLVVGNDSNGNVLFTLNNSKFSNPNKKYITVGDELNIYNQQKMFVTKVWVLKTEKIGNDYKLTLIDQQGNDFASCYSNSEALTGNSINFKVVRSGYRNLSSASMANITSTENPIYNGSVLRNNIHEIVNDKVVNASAVVYNDFWPSQCESSLPYLKEEDVNAIINDQGIFNEDVFVNKVLGKFNPFKYNVRGDWRAKQSYAFLTGRIQDTQNVDPRNDGFYSTFTPFYQYDDTSNSWTINKHGWTTASTVTKFSPFGAELENKDALNRYSSAQYGYDYTLPVAVASNTKYREIAYDGFEDHKPVIHTPIYGNHYIFTFPPTPIFLGVTTNYNKRHFNFEDAIADNSNAERTNTVAHTGRYSVKLAPSTKLILSKKLDDHENFKPIDGCETGKMVVLCNYGYNDVKYYMYAIVTKSHIDACTKIYDIDFFGNAEIVANTNIAISTLEYPNIELLALEIGDTSVNVSQLSSPYTISRPLLYIDGYNNDSNHIRIVVRTDSAATGAGFTINFTSSNGNCSDIGNISINDIECGFN